VTIASRYKFTTPTLFLWRFSGKIKGIELCS
jgi:hypothetical protein